MKQKNIPNTVFRFLIAIGLLMASVQSSQAGALLKLFYDPIAGAAMTNLTLSPIYPNAPTDRSVTVDYLENPVNSGENYGTLTRGYLEAPQTGQYTFWIASDDDGQFWLSTSSATNGLVKICENIGFVEQRDYTGKPMQKSAPISLVRGQKYYFEMLQTETFGGDHVSVAWTLPDGTKEWPIAGAHLMPFPVNETSPNVFEPRTTEPLFLTDYFGTPVPALADTSVEEGAKVTLAATIEATQPVVLQWYRGAVAITGENLSTYSISNASSADNGVQFSLVASNSVGVTTNSMTLSVSSDFTAPTLVSAIKRGPTQVTVVFSEPVALSTATNPSNYTFDNGATVSAASIGTKPNIVLLNTSSLTQGTVYTLTVNNVQDRASTPNTISAGSTVTLDQALKFWLKLDETSGTVAADSSGNGLNANLIGGPRVNVSGKVNSAINFDGIDDHGDLPDGFSDLGGGVTFSLWARPTALAFWSRFIEFGNGPGQDNILFARVGTTRHLALGFPGISIIALSVIDDDAWQHFAATIDPSGNCTLYKNGIPLVTNFLGVPSAVVRTNNYIGRSNWPAPDAYYAGKMDDVRVYNRTLSTAEIEALAASDPSVPVIEVTAIDAQAAEQGQDTGSVQFTRSGNTGAPLVVSYFVQGTASNGLDYTTLSGTVTIPAGTNSATVVVTPVDDAVLDQSETIVLNLAGSSNYVGGASESATITILDNEDSVPPQLRLATVDNVINVWFNEPLGLASVTNPVNYTLNGSAAVVTGATLFGARGTGISLTLSAPVTESGATITVANVKDVGGNTMTPGTIPLQQLVSSPLNIVASDYHSPDGNRAACFALVANGIVDNVGEPGGFDTFDGFVPDTDFAGMIYANAQQFTTIKVDLGRQFGDGGDWRAQPKVYILKNAADPNTTLPENEPDNWREVPAVLVSGNSFDTAGDASGVATNTPIVFDLSAVPLNQRTGFGWAVGGVAGDGPTSFISISELRAFGVAGTNQPVTITLQPHDRTVTEGQRAIFSVAATGTQPLSYQWQRNESDISGATDSTYTTPPTQTFENTDRFRVIVNNPVGPVTSSNAVLTVNADTTAPTVVTATLDTAIDVWFSEAVSAATATTLANYSLSDGSVTITNAVQDLSGRRVTLSLSAAVTQSNPTLTVSSMQDALGHTMTSQTNALQRLLSASNVVANNYGSAIPGGRAGAFAMSKDGIVDNLNNDGGWDTFGSSGNLSDFAGLIYPTQNIFNFIKVDLGNQFIDGGDWGAQPKVYLLKNNVDTSTTRPENDPTNWVEVSATLVSDSVFTSVVEPNPSPNTPIGFDLSQVPLTNRTAYGWAVGGVPGNGPVTFISITELRSYGVSAASLVPRLSVVVSGTDLKISWPASASGYTLETKGDISSSDLWNTVNIAPQSDGTMQTVTVPIGQGNAFFRLRQ